jgi:RNA polymerase sigma-70 factor (ECF subfamily)
MHAERQPADDDRIRNAMADGDFRQALEELVRTYQHLIVGFCVNMLGKTEQGEEVAQEVFLAAYNAMPHFRQQASVRTWLFAIARKQCLQTLRNRLRHQRLEQAQQNVIAEAVHRQPVAPLGEDPDAMCVLVQTSLQALDKAERALLLMRYDTGLPIVDMAHILGISVASVRRRLAQALRHLREKMPYDA